MAKILLFFILFFSNFSFAAGTDTIQILESCPKEKPILGYTECFSCTDQRSLSYHYPIDDISEWENKEEFYNHIKQHHQNSYKGVCQDVCPNRIEYCGFGWLGEGDCICGPDTLINRIHGLFFRNALEFVFGGWILFLFYMIISIRFFYTLKFWKNKFCQITISALLPISILFLFGITFIGEYVFTLMVGIAFLEFILIKMRK